ncbi:MAG: hypothetical protein IH597_08055 [Bacteroidales bacterium]|nr:hypothetical protein [Bacteroidales bacterium]
MVQKKNNTPNLSDTELKSDESNLPGYPSYPATDDIYSNYLEEEDINPEDILKTKGSEKENLDELLPGGDLDVPGSELDDDMEDIGSEDEENNYYSLGGDAHNDLDENHG